MISDCSTNLNVHSFCGCFCLQRIHSARPVNTNSLAFLVTGTFFAFISLGTISVCFSLALGFANSYTLFSFVGSTFALHDTEFTSNVTEYFGRCLFLYGN